MPVLRHMLEAVRQTFGWVGSFGAEEYQGVEAKRHALLWISLLAGRLASLGEDLVDEVELLAD